VENNLCLGGGIKLREGYFRTVRNNLIVSNTFHPHVWFEKSGDVFESNIVATPYQPIRLSGRGKSWDRNVHLSQRGLRDAKKFGVDANGEYTSLDFNSPSKLDFRFAENPVVRQAGFKPLDLTQFGVQKPSLIKLARKPEFVEPLSSAQSKTDDRVIELLGASFKCVTTDGEVSASGLPDKQGVLFLKVSDGSSASNAGIQAGDVVRSISGRLVNSPLELISTWANADQSQPIGAAIWRTQEEKAIVMPRFPGVALRVSEAKILGTAVFDKQKDYIGSWTDSETRLQWKTELKPKNTYRLLVTQASPEGNNSRWQLDGFQRPITTSVVPTGDWENFELVLVDEEVISKSSTQHVLEIAPSRITGAVMNLRGLVLIECGPKD
jgi:hypothetical protein